MPSGLVGRDIVIQRDNQACPFVFLITTKAQPSRRNIIKTVGCKYHHWNSRESDTSDKSGIFIPAKRLRRATVSVAEPQGESGLFLMCESWP